MTAPPSYHWLDRGQELPEVAVNAFDDNLDLPFRYFKLVLVRSSGNTMLVRWDPEHADASSIEAAIDRISEADAPTTLRFYKSGWFKEHYAHAQDAAKRIREVQSMRDVKIAHPAFIAEQAYEVEKLPPLIKCMMRHSCFYEEYAIENFLDEGIGDFLPSYSGVRSATSRVLGADWIEKGSLDHCVANQPSVNELVSAYHRVLDGWNPRYDQVIVALVPEGGEPVWVPYHRVTVPRRDKNGGWGTSCLISLGMVDIAPLGSTHCVW